MKGGRGADGRVLPAPATFLLALLWPRAVKYLRLTDNFSQADRLDDGAPLGPVSGQPAQSSANWIAARVHP